MFLCVLASAGGVCWAYSRMDAPEPPPSPPQPPLPPSPYPSPPPPSPNPPPLPPGKKPANKNKEREKCVLGRLPHTHSSLQILVSILPRWETALLNHSIPSHSWLQGSGQGDWHLPKRRRWAHRLPRAGGSLVRSGTLSERFTARALRLNRLCAPLSRQSSPPCHRRKRNGGGRRREYSLLDEYAEIGCALLAHPARYTGHSTN